MEKDTFAADAVKHCVRARDIVRQSAVILARRIHPRCLRIASEIALEDATSYFAKMSLRPSPWGYVPFDDEGGNGNSRLGRCPNVQVICKRVLKEMVGKVVMADRHEKKQEKEVRLTVRALVRKVENIERCV